MAAACTVVSMRKASILGLILFLGLVAGACSSDGGPSQVASMETGTAEASEEAETDPVAESEAAMFAFTQCLRDQGIDVDDPTMDANGDMQLPPIEFESEVAGTNLDQEPDVAAFEDIIAPCGEHLDGIVATPGPGGMTEFEDMLLAYAECMRSRGIDMPDPDFSAGGGMIDLGSGDVDGEEFEAADAECRPLLADVLSSD